MKVLLNELILTNIIPTMLFDLGKMSGIYTNFQKNNYNGLLFPQVTAFVSKRISPHRFCHISISNCSNLENIFSPL